VAVTKRPTSDSQPEPNHYSLKQHNQSRCAKQSHTATGVVTRSSQESNQEAYAAARQRTTAHTKSAARASRGTWLLLRSIVLHVVQLDEAIVRPKASEVNRQYSFACAEFQGADIEASNIHIRQLIRGQRSRFGKSDLSE